MNRIGERIIAPVLILLCLLFFLWYAMASQGVYQGGDTFQHFLIARFAPEHPHLFMDHWGKPLFTLLYALPAQGGYACAEAFTVVLGLSAAVFTYLSARKLNLHFPWLAIILVLFAPMFFVHLNSVMTEVLFASLLMAGLYLTLSKRFLVSALVLSLLPFVRTEGFVLVPVISIYFLLEKKWTAFFLLGTGLILFSIAGWLFVYHDIFWVFTQNPYKVKSFYGHGELFHFVTSNKVIWGIPFSIALAISLVISIAKYLTPGDPAQKRQWSILIVWPFLIFLLFHSIAWATGTLASNGELRVMVCTMPLAALLAMRTFNMIRMNVSHVLLRNAVVFLFATVVFVTPFQLLKVPLALGPAQIEIRRASEFVRANYPDRRVHFVDPQIPVELDRDPFDPAMAVQWFADPQHPDKQMNPGDILIWDAHFSAHEGGVSFKTLSEIPELQLKASFEPKKEHIIFGRERYFVAVFEYIRQP